MGCLHQDAIICKSYRGAIAATATAAANPAIGSGCDTVVSIQQLSHSSCHTVVVRQWLSDSHYFCQAIARQMVRQMSIFHQSYLLLFIARPMGLKDFSVLFYRIPKLVYIVSANLKLDNLNDIKTDWCSFPEGIYI